MFEESKDLQGIRANAELVVQQSKGISDVEDFGYDERSVKWLEGFIERQRTREASTPEFVEKLVSVLGSYLGECIIRCYGGEWSVDDDDGWHVRFDEKNAAYPFAKVQKQFANGLEDGIHSFFTTIPIVFRSLRQPGPQQNQPLQRTEAAVKRSWFQRLFGRGPAR